MKIDRLHRSQYISGRSSPLDPTCLSLTRHKHLIREANRTSFPCFTLRHRENRERKWDFENKRPTAGCLAAEMGGTKEHIPVLFIKNSPSVCQKNTFYSHDKFC